jgi:hypothetical protein
MKIYTIEGKEGCEICWIDDLNALADKLKQQIESTD